MPNNLSNLELDEVSLVGKAANGKKFLVFKSMKKWGDSTRTKPYRVMKAVAGEPISKADILSIIQKAVEPIRRENRELRDAIRARQYEKIAKADFGEIGTVEEGAAILKSLEGLSPESRRPILKALKQANALKKEAGKMLFSTMGSSHSAPGSMSAQFDGLVKKKLTEIRKSDTGKSEQVMHALAVTAVTKEHPGLAKAVIAEERANVVKMQMGVQ